MQVGKIAVISMFVGALQLAAKAQPPITTPAVISSNASSQPARLVVMITPFRSVGDPAKVEWIGGAIDEQLATDLSRNPSVRVVRAPTTGPSNSSTADGLYAARQAGAQRLIVGNYQSVDDQVRINGDIVDPSDGKPVGHSSVTGATHDLFKLEDSLAAELLHALPGVDEPDQSFTVTQIPSENIQPPIVIDNTPTDAGANVAYPGYAPYPNESYGGYGGYPGYGYGYGYLDSPFFVYLGGNRFHGRRGGYGNGGEFGGFRNEQTGGGAIVPTGRTPTIHSPTFPNGVPRNPGPASVTPSHGFVGPTAAAAEGHGNAGGGAGGGAGRR